MLRDDFETDDRDLITRRRTKPRQHELKTWPIYHRAMRRGLKPFDVRLDDRGFQTGDELLLREWDPDTKEYAGWNSRCRVLSILRGAPWLQPGYVIMGLEGIETWFGSIDALAAADAD